MTRRHGPWASSRCRQYRRQFNTRLGEFTGEALHDKHTHPADAFRMLAVAHKPPEEPKPIVDEYSYQFPSALDWLGV